MLINSGVRFGGGPQHHFGAASAGVAERSKWGEIGALRNFYTATATMVANESIANKSGYPSGVRHPISWCMAPKGGGMSSYRRASITLTSTGVGALGREIVGDSTITLNCAAIGGLIAGGVGSAAISINGDGDILATIGAPGSATISLSAVATPGAIGFLEGNSAVNLNGTLVSYAIGHMVGSTEESGLTVSGIVNAVWNAVAANYNDSGSMGARLNSAASGGVDYEAMAEAVRTELAVELTRLTKLAKLHAIDATLVVTPTTRIAGDVSQTINTVGDTTTVE